MSKLVLNGDTSGSVTLDAPAISGTTTLTLPTTSGTVLTTATGQTLTSPVIAGTPTGVGVLTSDTAKTATSTSVDFTGIPSWVKRITVIFSAVSTNGTSSIIVQLGAGSFEATGYLGSGANGANSPVAFTTGIPSVISLPAANAFYGTTTVVTTGSNTWVGNSTIGSSATGNPQYGGGGKTIGGTLDRLRITTVNGTDTFDAGTINILYE